MEGNPPGALERFGLAVMRRFRGGEQVSSGLQGAFGWTDAQLRVQVQMLATAAQMLTAIVSLVFVMPMVSVALATIAMPLPARLAINGAITVACVGVEILCLFIVSLWAAHRLGKLLFLHDTQQDGAFGVSRLLVRAALELDDPEVRLLGVDPFKRISRRNLLVIGLVYKLKIVLTNAVLKFVLSQIMGGPYIGPVPIECVAFPVEVFWNAVVMWNVIRESRLRLFGNVLSLRICADAAATAEMLSLAARTVCIRAIANSIVLTKHYHANMVMLLLRFQRLLHVSDDDSPRYDDWALFCGELALLDEPERNFCLDMLTVAAAFDGKLSDLEHIHLREAYQADFDLYRARLLRLTACLTGGQLNEALALCGLDFAKG